MVQGVSGQMSSYFPTLLPAAVFLGSCMIISHSDPRLKNGKIVFLLV